MKPPNKPSKTCRILITISMMFYFSVAYGQRKCLFISDIHLDPLLDTSLNDKLLKKPIEKWDSLFNCLTSDTLAHGKKDVSFKTFNDMLLAASSKFSDTEQPLFIVITGDFLWHGTKQTPEKDIQQLQLLTFKYIAYKFRKTFKNVPIIPVLGNNDTDKGDNNPQTEVFCKAFYDTWQKCSTIQYGTSMCAKGYYDVSIPAIPNLKFIVLNTNLVNGFGSKVSADSMLSWLHDELAALEPQKKSWILMHNPPGKDAIEGEKPLWQKDYTDQFLFNIDKFADLNSSGKVTGIFAGHIHRNDFRIILRNKIPINFVRLIPSVSANYWNNPSFMVADFDMSSLSITKQLIYYLKLGDQAMGWNNVLIVDGYLKSGYSTPIELSNSLKALRAERKGSMWADFFTVENTIQLNEKQTEKYQVTLKTYDRYWETEALAIIRK